MHRPKGSYLGYNIVSEVSNPPEPEWILKERGEERSKRYCQIKSVLNSLRFRQGELNRLLAVCAHSSLVFETVIPESCREEYRRALAIAVLPNAHGYDKAAAFFPYPAQILNLNLSILNIFLR